MHEYSANENARRDRENRYSWSDSDWDNAIRRALRPQTRQDERGRWEYLVHGNWVDQSTFDDPMFQQNIYQPWQEDVQAYWAGEREKANKYRQNKQEGGRLAEARRRAAMQRQGAGGMRSSTSSGGGF